MKNQTIIITERHPACAPPPDQAVRKTITAWLAKELRK